MSEHPLVALLGKRSKRVVGLMSGTSLDGIDAALVEIDGSGASTKARLIDFRTTPFTSDERAAVEKIILHGTTPEVCALNFALGETFARAALEIAQGRPIDLIGSHGQTIWHAPPSRGGSSTLQIAEPAVIAARTGVVTVGDFRVADVAVGGEGAPLVSWCDWALFRWPGHHRALQNIGGIANVTLVGDALNELIAFDNGPGNMIADALAKLVSNGQESFDRDGALSAKGRVLDDVLGQLLDDDYLKEKPPKSTGRERYGQRFVDELLTRHRDRDRVDLLATVVAFTAEAIARSYRDHLPRLPDEVLVSGGGAHNRTLMARLQQLLQPIPVRRFDEGISPDAKEAVAFAVLAVQAIHAEPANVVSVTGARLPAVLGKICLPPRLA